MQVGYLCLRVAIPSGFLVSLAMHFSHLGGIIQ